MPRRLFIGLFLLPLPLFAAPPKDELAYAVGAAYSRKCPV